MDSSFVWILIFAGAAVALLGLFLVASERELKAKRREIEELLAKVENSDVGRETPAPHAGAAGFTDETALPDQQTRNGESDRLRSEIAVLAETLSASRTRVAELEAAQQSSADLESGHRREQDDLRERIAELESRLASAQHNVAELQAVRERLIRAEAGQAALAEESRRREDEITRLRERLAAAEELGQRLAALQRPWHELLSRQAALVDGERRLQEELAAFSRLIEMPARDSRAVPDRADPGEDGAADPAPADAEVFHAKQTRTS